MNESGEAPMMDFERDFSNQDKIEAKKSKPEPINEKTALEKLREHDPKEITLRDGKTLIHAGMQDFQAGMEPGEEEPVAVLSLRTFDTALTAIEDNDIQSLDYATISKLREFFTDKINDWDMASFSDADPDAYKNRVIYHAVLTDILSKLPTPEAVLPDFPTYNSKLLEPIISPLENAEEITVSSVAQIYDKFAETVTASKDKAESDDQWMAHKEAINTAVEKWDGVALSEIKPLLVTVEDGKITTTDITPEEHLPEHADGVTQFILDPQNDIEHFTQINELDYLDRYTPFGIEGLKRLQGDEPTLTYEEVGGINLLIAQFEKGLNNGTINKKYEPTFKKLSAFIKNKVENTEIIREPGSEETADDYALVS